MAIDWKELRQPFSEDDLEWRVQQDWVKDGRYLARVLPYVSARALQEQLDEVVLEENWMDEYRTVSYVDTARDHETRERRRVESTGVICRLTITDPETGKQFIGENGSGCTDFESLKGGISGAFKRVCASRFGMGRYLYYIDMDHCWAVPADKSTGKYKTVKRDRDGNTVVYYWNPPRIPEWAQPGGSGKPDRETSGRRRRAEELAAEAMRRENSRRRDSSSRR